MDGKGIAGMMIALMVTVIVAIWNGLGKVCDGCKVFLIRLIKGESLNPRDFKKKELSAVISAVAVIIVVIVVLCIL